MARKKKKRRPDDPPEQDETRGEGIEETSADASGETSTETRKPSFFSFSGQLTPAELKPDAPSEEKPDVVEGALEAPPAEPQQPESTTAGPVRDQPPAASTSASQTDEAAGPAAFPDDTHTEVHPGHSPESDTSLRIPGPGEAAGTPTAPGPRDSTATDPFALPEPPQATPAQRDPGPVPPVAPFGPVTGEQAPFADEGATKTEVGFDTTGSFPGSGTPPAPDAGAAPAPSDASEEAPPDPGEETAGRTTRTQAGPAFHEDAESTKTGLGGVAPGVADDTRTRSPAARPEDADATGTSAPEAPPRDADETRTSFEDLGDADATRTSHGGAADEATRTRQGRFEDAGATHTELGLPDLDLPDVPAAPSTGPKTRAAPPAPEAEGPDATHTEFRPFAAESETRARRPAVPDETVAVPEEPAPAEYAPALFQPDDAPEATAPFGDTPLFVAPEVRVGDLDTEVDPSAAPVRRRRVPTRRRPSLLQRVRTAAGRLRGRVAELRARAAAVREERRAQTARVKADSKLSQNAQWWRRTLTEIAVLYAIVIPVEMALNKGRIGAYGVHPHPYWLIVLPMAGARGVVAGLLSAGVASVLYTLGAWLARGGGDPTVLFTYRTMTEPILFFAVGYFVGELHDHLELKVQKLQRHLDEVQERNARLRQERDVLGDANRELEKRIVDDSVQFGNLIVAATRIERAGRNEVFELSLELVEEHCGAAGSVLMLLEDGSLDFLCTRGWPDDQVGTRLAAARGSAFVARAIGEGVAVNGFAPEETPPESGPLVVAPLFDAGGVVRALLCLDEIPPTRLNESTITTFLGIAEWVSAALSRLARGHDAPAPKEALEPVAEADVHMGTAKELGERLRLEVERCTRYGVPTSFLAIQAPEWKDASPEGVRMLDRYILTHFTTGMRPSDAMYRFGYPGCYLLVLAGTTVEGADVVRTRLLRRVEYSPQRHVGAVEIFATGPDASAPDLPSLVGRVAERFRRASPLPLEGRCPVEIPETARPAGIDAFLRRLKMETSLAVRNGFDLFVLGISAEMADEAAPDLLVRHVHEAGVRTLRPTDGVYAIGPRHCAVICPCTDAEQAATVAHRLATAVRKRDPDAPYGQLESKVVGLGAAHPDAGSLLEALAKRRTS